MERKLALWIGVPFLGVAWALTVLVVLAPGRIAHARLLMALLLVLAVAGICILLLRIVTRYCAGSPVIDALYPIAGILVAIGIAFHQQVGAAGRAIVHDLAPGAAPSDGMRFARAADGQFHVTLTVEGAAVDFMADVSTPFNVMMPDVPRQIGISPSSLIYSQRIELSSGAEYAADVVVPKARLGSVIIENLPIKVFATGRGRNVLGKPFFDGLKAWHIDGDTLIIVQ